MLVDLRVIDEHNFVKFIRTDEHTVIGKLIRLEPTPEDMRDRQVSGSYTEYRTPPCPTEGAAELAVHALLDRLDGEDRHYRSDEESSTL